MSEVMELWDEAAERGVLGVCLLAPEKVDVFAAMGLRVEVFYAPKHGMVWGAMLGLRSDGGGLDVVSVVDRLRCEGVLAEVGGLRGVAEITGGAESVLWGEHWVGILLRLYRARRAVDVGKRLALRAMEDQAEVDRVVQDATRELQVLGEVNRGMNQPDMVAAAEAMFDRELSGLQDARQIRTGLLDFDLRLEPLRVAKEDFLAILFAPPSGGKSSLARQIVRVNVADGKRVVSFLRETVGTNFYMQMAANWAGFNLHYASKPPDMNANEGRDYYDWVSARDATKANFELIREEWAGKRLWVYDADKTIGDIERRSRMLAQQAGGLDLITVDYLQIVRSDKDAWSRENEVADISSRLKDLGKEMQCPVLCLVQMNREGRRGIPAKDKETGEEYMKLPVPQLTDLRESGAIEQDADRAWAIYVPSHDYNGHLQRMNQMRLVVEIHQLKFRNGPVGKRRFMFRKDVTRFEDMPNVSADGKYKKKGEY